MSGSIYGYDVLTDVPFARLQREAGTRGVISLRLADRLEPEGELVHSWAEYGDWTFELIRSERLLYGVCSITGTFAIDAAAGTIEAAPGDRGPDAFWEHRMVSVAFPLLLAERGELVAHASAVVGGGMAVLLAGPPGRGKSTLALLAPRLGYALVAEDGVVVSLDADGPIVWPGPRGVRVLPDVLAQFEGAAVEGPRKSTRLLPEGSYTVEPVPLGAFIVLDERRGRTLDVTRLDPLLAVPPVIPTLIFGGTDRLARAFAQTARLVQQVPVYRASMPDDLDAAPTALAELLTTVAPGAGDDGRVWAKSHEVGTEARAEIR